MKNHDDLSAQILVAIAPGFVSLHTSRLASLLDDTRKAYKDREDDWPAEQARLTDLCIKDMACGAARMAHAMADEHIQQGGMLNRALAKRNEGAAARVLFGPDGPNLEKTEVDVDLGKRRL